MSGVNKVILVGHLGKDPEIRHLEGGTAIAKISVATSEPYKKDGVKVDHTEWHNVILWRTLAENAEKVLRKGALVYVEGKIRSRSWEDKDKNKRWTTEIIADNFTILGSPKRDDNGVLENGSSENGKTAEPIGVEHAEEVEQPTDGLPF